MDTVKLKSYAGENSKHTSVRSDTQHPGTGLLYQNGEVGGISMARLQGTHGWMVPLPTPELFKRPGLADGFDRFDQTSGHWLGRLRCSGKDSINPGGNKMNLEVAVNQVINEDGQHDERDQVEERICHTEKRK